MTKALKCGDFAEKFLNTPLSNELKAHINGLYDLYTTDYPKFTAMSDVFKNSNINLLDLLPTIISEYQKREERNGN